MSKTTKPVATAPQKPVSIHKPTPIKRVYAQVAENPLVTASKAITASALLHFESLGNETARKLLAGANMPLNIDDLRQECATAIISNGYIYNSDDNTIELSPETMTACYKSISDAMYGMVTRHVTKSLYIVFCDEKGNETTINANSVYDLSMLSRFDIIENMDIIKAFRAYVTEKMPTMSHDILLWLEYRLQGLSVRNTALAMHVDYKYAVKLQYHARKAYNAIK